MQCVLCGSGESTLVSERDRHGEPLATRVCDGCGLVWNDPVPGDAELEDFYANHYRVAYKGAFEPRNRQIVRNFRRAREHVETFGDVIAPARHVLDVGAGSGEFLLAVSRNAQTAIGIEPNRGYAEYCRTRLSLDVRTDKLRAGMFDDESFDLIRLNHVLEHLNDPVRALTMIARMLKPDGVFYVEVPNIDVHAQMKAAGNLFHFGHIFNFNPWTLRAAGALAGLEEDARTRERSANTTGVFFRKASSVAQPQDVRNPDNAAQVLAAIRAHYEGRPAMAGAARMLTRWRLRVGETLTGLRFRDPAAIGRAILSGKA